MDSVLSEKMRTDIPVPHHHAADCRATHTCVIIINYTHRTESSALQIMVASQQVLVHQHSVTYEYGDHVDTDMDAPRFASLVVSCYAIYAVFCSGGVWLGCISAALTLICVAPLFNLSWRAEGRVMQEATTEDADRSSHIFTEASIQELENMRG